MSLRDALLEITTSIKTGRRSEMDAVTDILAKVDEERGWLPISTAPKDGTAIDVWCVPPVGAYFATMNGGIRLTDVMWHDGDNFSSSTGWFRILEDGEWDFVEENPVNNLGLPPWKPIYWMPVPIYLPKPEQPSEPDRCEDCGITTLSPFNLHHIPVDACEDCKPKQPSQSASGPAPEMKPEVKEYLEEMTERNRLERELSELSAKREKRLLIGQSVCGCSNLTNGMQHHVGCQLIEKQPDAKIEAMEWLKKMAGPPHTPFTVKWERCSQWAIDEITRLSAQITTARRCAEDAQDLVAKQRDELIAYKAVNKTLNRELQQDAIELTCLRSELSTLKAENAKEHKAIISDRLHPVIVACPIRECERCIYRERCNVKGSEVKTYGWFKVMFNESKDTPEFKLAEMELKVEDHDRRLSELEGRFYGASNAKPLQLEKGKEGRDVHL